MSGPGGMRGRWIKYYERPSATAPLAFLCRSLIARSPDERLGLLNRLNDYRSISESASLLALHRDLNQLLLAEQLEWPSPKYGSGYFYQGWRHIGITGLRDTDARMRGCDIERYVAGKRVLDIGCNAGFLSLAIAQSARQVVAFDVNPFMVAIAQRTADHLRMRNCTFRTTAFESFDDQGDRFDVVASFANHSTWDRNTAHAPRQYFTHCAAVLDPAGVLLFESHHPDYESEEAVEGIVEIMRERFTIGARMKTSTGGRYDRGRTFIVASPRTAVP